MFQVPVCKAREFLSAFLRIVLKMRTNCVASSNKANRSVSMETSWVPLSQRSSHRAVSLDSFKAMRALIKKILSPQCFIGLNVISSNGTGWSNELWYVLNISRCSRKLLRELSHPFCKKSCALFQIIFPWWLRIAHALMLREHWCLNTGYFLCFLFLRDFLSNISHNIRSKPTWNALLLLS